MKAVFLDLGTVGPDNLSLQPLEQLPVDWQFYSSTQKSELAKRLQHADIVVSNKCVLDAIALESAGGIKYITAAATGYNHIDLQAAGEAGIPVSNVRNYATHSVVQHVYALILSLSTRLRDYTAAVHRGEWEKSDKFCLLDYPIEEVSGKSLGIIGYGVLGRAVAAVAPAFGMDVMITQSLTGTASEDRIPLDDLLSQADIISLHVPLTDKTRNLIGEQELKMMKSSALLINAARGGIVDETALAHALKEGQIAGAGIDVLSQEPPPGGNPLLDDAIPNLVLTPHTAWASRQARQTLIDEIARNIDAFLNGEVRNPVG